MSDSEATDIDAAYWNQRQWGAAISEWIDGSGNMDAIVALARNDQPLPDFARQFLADLLTNIPVRALDVARKEVGQQRTGRPEERDPWVERAIVSEVFFEWERVKGIPRKDRDNMNPKDYAMTLVAERRGLENVRHVVQKLQGDGITLERWVSWGRPDWRNPNR